MKQVKWLYLMIRYSIFHKATGRDFECLHHKEIINIWGFKSSNFNQP
jgi:hypothetical protein